MSPIRFEISPLGVLAVGLWLEELLERCPFCGSLNTIEGIGVLTERVCVDCGGGFDPFDPKHVQARRQAVKDTFRGMEGE